jgi:D-alanyl-D-alanine carboxypeptidase (penicillin-binding protein 5/6)
MRPRVPALAAAVLLVAVGRAAAPAAGATAPSLERAAAAILVDGRTGEPILQKDPRERRAIASATKLMTALLALEQARPRDVFAAPAYDALPVESQIRLARGERMRVEDLLEALLLESANDAAVTIAAGVSGSRSAFVSDMNTRAAELGLEDTRFANPIGLDDPQNHSTARDLALLSVRLMRYPGFRRIVDTPRATLESGSRRRVVANRNRLIGRHGFVDGIKTGHTLSAGYVLVGAATGKGGARVVSVVLGEPSESARDADTLALLRYGLRQFRRLTPVRAGRVVARVDVKHRDDRVAIVPSRSLRTTARKGERVRRRASLPGELDGPLAKGERVGTVAVLRAGRVVGRVPLVTAEAVPGAGPLRVVASTLGTPLAVLLVLALLGGAALALLRLRAKK